MPDDNSLVTDFLIVAGGSTATYYLLRWILGKPCGWGIECPIPDVFPFSYLREKYCPKLKEKQEKKKEECKEYCPKPLELTNLSPDSKPESLIAVQISKEQYEILEKNPDIIKLKEGLEGTVNGEKILNVEGSWGNEIVKAVGGVTIGFTSTIAVFKIIEYARGFEFQPVIPKAVSFVVSGGQTIYYVIGYIRSFFEKPKTIPSAGNKFKDFNEAIRESKQKSK